MATLSAHLTELEAVNDMLESIGESPVSSLASGLGDAQLALSNLRRASREVQLVGWHCNTRRDVQLTPNGDGIIGVGVNVLKIDTVDPSQRRRNSGSTVSYNGRRINVSLRRNVADTGYNLYDVANDTQVWSDVSSINVDIVEYLPFENLTPALQIYIYKRAGHEFQQSTTQSKVLFEFTRAGADEAMWSALAEEEETEGRNMIHDNPGAYIIAARNSPLFGR